MDHAENVPALTPPVTDRGTAELNVGLPEKAGHAHRPGGRNRTTAKPFVPACEVNRFLAAEQLIDEIAAWPDLNELLTKEALWRYQHGGPDALAYAGIQRHQGRFSFLSDSPVAIQLVKHFIHHQRGVRSVDERDMVWAVCGGPFGDGEWSSLAISLGHHDFPGSGLKLAVNSYSPALVVQAAQHQELLAAVELLLWLVGESGQRRKRGFSLTIAALSQAIGLPSQGNRKEATASLETMISIINSFAIRSVRMVLGSWQFVPLHEGPAVQLMRIRPRRIDVEISPLLQEVLSNFFRVA